MGGPLGEQLPQNYTMERDITQDSPKDCHSTLVVVK